MNLLGDIRNKRLLRAKGVLFLVLGIVSGSLLLAERMDLRSLALLVICIWSFCRFYYFLFHVLERYAGSGRPYAGVIDALKHALTRGPRP